MSLHAAVTDKATQPVALANAFDVYVMGSAGFPGVGHDNVVLHHVDGSGMWFRSARRPSPGSVLKFALRGFEDFDAVIVRHEEDGFLAMPTAAMGISSLVAEVAKAPRSMAGDAQRRHERIVPKDLRALLKLDGNLANVTVIDISISGAAVESLLRPKLGTEVVLGRMKGRVVRHLSNGFAIEFDDMLGQVSAEMRSL